MTIFEKRGIATKVVESLKKEARLLKFTENVLNHADMNTNTLKNFIRYAREISSRQNIDFDVLGERLNLSEIIGDSKLSERDKAEEIIKRLYKLRYPLWSEKQSLFSKLKNKFYAATGGGEIIFPDFAEGNSFKMVFTIKNGEDIDKIFDAISKAEPIMREALKEIKENV